MKKYLIVVLFMFIGIVSYSQVDFKWDVITDSLADNKNDLYSKTKLFISENWKSAQNVIQNDDKEAGIILIKGTTKISRHWVIATSWSQNWIFSYTIKFFLKDSKCRIVLDDVRCKDARDNEYNSLKLIPVADKYPQQKGRKKTGLPEDKYLELMIELKTDLQSISDLYSNYIKVPIIKNDEW